MFIRFVERGAGFGARQGCGRSRAGHGHFFGLDAEKMSPKAQVATALAVLAPVALGAVLVLAAIPQVFWLFFVFGWTIFPAFGLLVRGVAGLLENPPPEDRVELPGNVKERELLEALRREGELTPARAAMESSLSVAEADRMLKELAEGGHLEVRVRGGGIFYALWGSADGGKVNEPDVR